VVQPVDEFALASRLSYFLWSSLPDDELCALAGRKALRKNLEQQVKRMLRDPKAQALVDNFAGQWLQIRNLKLVAPDKSLFPDFDDNLRASMAKETELFFTDIVRQDRSVLEFLDADYTFVDGRLAKLYDLPGITGELGADMETAADAASLGTLLTRMGDSGGRYQCDDCGLNSVGWYWHCPKCRSWDSMRPAVFKWAERTDQAAVRAS